jgi:hypothetical protein
MAGEPTSQIGNAALGGGFLGLVAGGVGGFIAARERRKALERFRVRQQEGITRARADTESRVEALTDNPLLQAANRFLLGSFEGGEQDPLVDQFAKRLRVAQEARGLRRSTAGAVAEASSLAAFRTQLLANLLPQAERFGTLEERFRQRILSQELPIGIAFETGAPIPGVSQFTPDIGEGFSPLAGAFQGAVSGGLGGAQIGQSFADRQQQNTLIGQLLAQNQGQQLQGQNNNVLIQSILSGLGG